MKLVAAIKLKPTREQAAVLRATLKRYNEACTAIAAKGFAAGVPMVAVDPCNTSKGCSACGCIDARNRSNQATMLIRLTHTTAESH